MKIKKVIIISLGTIVLFCIINLATASLNFDADGADSYGFPFNFYYNTTGYNIYTKQGATAIKFSTINLIGDIFFTLCLTLIALKAYHWLKRKIESPG